MKYIRTKDGRIIGFEPKTKDLDLIKYLSQFINYQGEYAPISQADTIKELCDEFVGVSDVLSTTEHFIITERLKNKKENERITFSGGIYGAIWTDKGLIFVAKMNDKGELELL